MGRVVHLMVVACAIVRVVGGAAANCLYFLNKSYRNLGKGEVQAKCVAFSFRRLV